MTQVQTTDIEIDLQDPLKDTQMSREILNVLYDHHNQYIERHSNNSKCQSCLSFVFHFLEFMLPMISYMSLCMIIIAFYSGNLDKYDNAPKALLDTVIAAFWLSIVYDLLGKIRIYDSSRKLSDTYFSNVVFIRELKHSCFQHIEFLMHLIIVIGISIYLSDLIS